LYALLWTRWLEPTFGDVALGDVSVETVRTWLAEARSDHPSSTQPANAYRLLRTILNVAVDDEKIPVNPCRIRGAGKETAPERPVAMPDEVLPIADAIDGQYRALVILGAWCSLRFGELAGLRRSRVDLLRRRSMSPSSW
jgi:integrase